MLTFLVSPLPTMLTTLDRIRSPLLTLNSLLFSPVRDILRDMELAIPIDDVVSRLQKRWLETFAEAVEEWSAYVSALSRWEDDHLLDTPTPEVLSEHRTAVDRLLTFGRLLSCLDSLVCST